MFIEFVTSGCAEVRNLLTKLISAWNVKNVYIVYGPILTLIYQGPYLPSYLILYLEVSYDQMQATYTGCIYLVECVVFYYNVLAYTGCIEHWGKCPSRMCVLLYLFT